MEKLELNIGELYLVRHLAARQHNNILRRKTGRASEKVMEMAECKSVIDKADAAIKGYEDTRPNRGAE